MKYFYKIEDNKLKLGSGYTIPSGFIEYTKGQEPQELLDILNKENFNKTKNQILDLLKNKIQSKITSGIIFGSNIIKTDLVAQQNGQANYSLAVSAMSNAKTYATSTSYNPIDIILEGGVYYITFNGGTTGDTKPTFPAEFQVEVQDNEVTWYKFGLLVSTENGNKYFTPQEIESMFIQFNLITTDLRKAYDEYKSKIEAVTANDELDILKTEIEAL
jgi:uncharacterized protein YehS (DUF1456 family)